MHYVFDVQQHLQKTACVKLSTDTQRSADVALCECCHFYLSQASTQLQVQLNPNSALMRNTRVNVNVISLICSFLVLCKSAVSYIITVKKKKKSPLCLHVLLLKCVTQFFSCLHSHCCGSFFSSMDMMLRFNISFFF